MTDYISREAAEGIFATSKENWKDYEAAACIAALPAADVRPVVRGTWVGIDDFPHEDWECDHCGCVVGNTDDPWNYYHFCPNCGADMREES